MVASSSASNSSCFTNNLAYDATNHICVPVCDSAAKKVAKRRIITDGRKDFVLELFCLDNELDDTFTSY